MTLQSTVASPAADTTDLTAVDASTAVIDNDTGLIDANTADSSAADAQGAKEPLDLLSVVKSAIEPIKAPEASPAPEDNQAEIVDDAAAAEAAPAADDDVNLPFHNHPRWKAVLAERDTFKGDAERYGKITGFMETHSLQPDEVAEGFEVMALLKSSEPENLKKALEWFEARTDALRGMVGATLPADIQERLDDGLIDEESAAELARARAATALQEKRTAASEERTAEERTAQEATDREQAMTSAIEEWEVKIKASDPDYAKKAEMVETTCRAIVQASGKPPTNAAEAVALVDQALAKVNAQFKSLLPKPRQIVPAPHGSSAIAPSAPKSLREAVDQGLARSK